MADPVEYKVTLDPEKVQTLARIWKQENSEKLLQSLFDLAYHHYVEEEDELIPGKMHKRATYELEAQLRDLQKKLASRNDGEKEKQTTLCPKCFSRVRYDKMSRDYECDKCGWEGPPEEVIRHEPQS